MQYYVYLLIDPKNNQPFYVGKGSGNRMYQHQYNRKNHLNGPLGDKISNILKVNSSIIYEKVLINVDETTAFKKEIELIKLYGREDLKTGSLLNRSGGGEGNGGWSSLRCKEKSKQELLKRKGNPVSQYDLDSNFISHYSSAKVASENTTGNRSYISQCCKGKRKSSGGFMWTYRGDPIPIFTKQYYSPVHQVTLSGSIVAKYKSLTEAQDRTGIELHNISECCRGKSKTAGGYIWKYIHH